MCFCSLKRSRWKYLALWLLNPKSGMQLSQTKLYIILRSWKCDVLYTSHTLHLWRENTCWHVFKLYVWKHKREHWFITLTNSLAPVVQILFHLESSTNLLVTYLNVCQSDYHVRFACWLDYKNADVRFVVWFTCTEQFGPVKRALYADAATERAPLTSPSVMPPWPLG